MGTQSLEAQGSAQPIWALWTTQLGHSRSLNPSRGDLLLLGKSRHSQSLFLHRNVFQGAQDFLYILPSTCQHPLDIVFQIILALCGFPMAHYCCSQPEGGRHLSPQILFLLKFELPTLKIKTFSHLSLDLGLFLIKKKKNQRTWQHWTNIIYCKRKNNHPTCFMATKVLNIQTCYFTAFCYLAGPLSIWVCKSWTRGYSTFIVVSWNLESP